MKKGTSKILSALLIATLVFTSAGVAFADSGESEAKKGIQASVQVDPQVSDVAEEQSAALATEKVSKKSIDKKLMSIKPTATTYDMAAPVMSYSTTSKPAFDGGILQEAGDYLLRVKANATGKLYIDGKVASDSADTATFYVCTSVDETAGTFSYIDLKTVNPGSTANGIGGLDVVQNKIYSILIRTYGANTSVSLRPYVYSYTSGRTLPVNKIMLTSGIKGSSTTPDLYYKIKPSKTGTIAVSITEYGMSSSAGYVTLYNSKKKAISSKTWYYSKDSSSRAYFGVKANTTYYVKISDARGAATSQYKYGVKYTNTKVKDLSLAKKSKAKTLKRKAKTATSTVFVASTSKSTDWYKFKVTKKRATQIKVNTSGIKSGKISVTVYKGSKKIGKTQTIPCSASGATYKITYGTTYGKANAGTYYVKVQQGTKASGKYSIKYVK